MREWPHKVLSWDKLLIQRFCVQDAEWQRYRRAMKGESTEKKLDMLEQWRLLEENDNREIVGRAHIGMRCQCQIDNYINALKRGGQLNMDLTIKRER